MASFPHLTPPALHNVTYAHHNGKRLHCLMTRKGRKNNSKMSLNILWVWLHMAKKIMMIPKQTFIYGYASTWNNMKLMCASTRTIFFLRWANECVHIPLMEMKRRKFEDVFLLFLRAVFICRKKFQDQNRLKKKSKIFYCFTQL